MMDDFLQFLREPIAQRSLLACVMIGFANGFVSGLVILKKSALQIGTLSCALLLVSVFCVVWPVLSEHLKKKKAAEHTQRIIC